MFTRPLVRHSHRRLYHVLAIESSCDDASVALIDRRKGCKPQLVDHAVETLDHSQVGGIVPTEAKRHHQKSLAPLVDRLLKRHASFKPDLICATRGPGMMGSLSAGLNLAKGLALGCGVPLVGVHHMLGHLLTARFFTNGESPQFPFVSLLASGGHTMLVLSESITKHKVLANTVDIAIGDMLDKCGREMGLKGTAIGREMEQLIDMQFDEPTTVPDQVSFPNPLQNEKGRVDLAAFSFAAFISAMKRNAELFFDNDLTKLSLVDKRQVAQRVESAIFTHLVSKTVLALRKNNVQPMDFVCSGGVASNQHLRDMLQEQLPGFAFHFPEPRWCTDNAMMIGWAGIELYEQGITTDMSVLSQAKWPIQEIMDLDGWIL